MGGTGQTGSFLVSFLNESIMALFECDEQEFRKDVPSFCLGDFFGL